MTKSKPYTKASDHSRAILIQWQGPMNRKILFILTNTDILVMGNHLHLEDLP